MQSVGWIHSSRTFFRMLLMKNKDMIFVHRLSLLHGSVVWGSINHWSTSTLFRVQIFSKSNSFFFSSTGTYLWLNKTRIPGLEKCWSIVQPFFKTILGTEMIFVTSKSGLNTYQILKKNSLTNTQKKANNSKDPLEIYNSMYKSGIGTTMSSFYVLWAIACKDKNLKTQTLSILETGKKNVKQKRILTKIIFSG